MRTKTFLILAVGMMLAPLPAVAQRAAPAWTLIARTRELAWFVDTARIAAAGPATTVWLRFDYPQPQPVPSDPSRHFSRVETQTALDCAGQRATDLVFRTFDATGDRLVADDPTVRGHMRSFERHPLGQLFVITCQVLEARRRGQLRQMIQALQRAPVPGRIGAADNRRAGRRTG